MSACVLLSLWHRRSGSTVQHYIPVWRLLYSRNLHCFWLQISPISMAGGGAKVSLGLVSIKPFGFLDLCQSSNRATAFLTRPAFILNQYYNSHYSVLWTRRTWCCQPSRMTKRHTLGQYIQMIQYNTWTWKNKNTIRDMIQVTSVPKSFLQSLIREHISNSFCSMPCVLTGESESWV